MGVLLPTLDFFFKTKTAYEVETLSPPVRSSFGYHLIRGFDADQMVAEARAHRWAKLPRRQAAQARQKLGIKPGLVALHPAQIAAPRATHRVRRLLLGRVLELHRTSRDLVPQAPRFRERRRRVGGVG